MPTLLLSSRFSTDSQILRRAARERGWDTFRFDGIVLPDWFDPPDEQIAMFWTPPSAFQIAEQLSRRLLGCSPDWTPQLPYQFLRRELRQLTLREALNRPGKAFVKHAVSKAFPAGVYDSEKLAEATVGIPEAALVHVGEVVDWSVEYRCFINHRHVAAVSPYRRHEEIYQDHASMLDAPSEEIGKAREFASSVVGSPIDCPEAFVLDVGLINDREWGGH